MAISYVFLKSNTMPKSLPLPQCFLRLLLRGVCVGRVCSFPLKRWLPGRFLLGTGDTHKAMVHSEKRHLTGFIQKIGKRDEGIRSVQVQDQHCGYEGHALHLREGGG